MASDPEQQPGDSAVAPPDAPTVNLQVISPSAGITRPLLFSALSGLTTIKQLKEKIRTTLPSRPADENQRLIHRGRALVRESDTLVDIFGAETLRSPDQQTIHLVVRDAVDGHASAPPALPEPARGRSWPAPDSAFRRPISPAPPRPQMTGVLPIGQPQGSLPRPGHLPPNMVDAALASHRRQLEQYEREIARQTAESRTPSRHRNPFAVPRGPENPPPQPPQQPGSEQAAEAYQAAQAQMFRSLQASQASAPPPTLPGQQAAAAASPFANNPQLQHQHQTMTQWLTQLQRDAMTRTLNHNQRNRAQMGMRGVGDQPQWNGGQPQDTAAQRRTPSAPPTHTIVRETWGPNGRSYQVDTIVGSGGIPTAVNPDTHYSHYGGLSTSEVQNIIRNADANQAAHSMATAMQRSASSTSLHGRPFTQPGVTNPIYPSLAAAAAAGSRSASGRATPEARFGRVGAHATHAPQQTSTSAQGQQGLEVYIVSSPDGPRALLVNNSTAESYYTPMLSHPVFRSTMSSVGTVTDTQMRQRTNFQQQPEQLPQQQAQPPPQAQQPPAQQPAQGQQGPPVNLGHPQNPALPPLLMQVLPHIWTLFRLGIFIWLFTSPNTSWARWLSIVGLAILMFVFSTGVLTGLADQAWRPIGRYLENIIPPLDQAGGRREDGGLDNRQGAGPDGRDAEPDPAQVAARWMAEHEQREGWLAVQLRRLERAALLFLASIAPGVAEGHIAHLEEEAQRERQRREAEAAAQEAARLAAEETAAGENAANQDGEANPDTQPQQPPAGGEQTSEVQGDQQQGNQGAEQLIVI